MATPAATAERMPEAWACSATTYAAKGVSRLISTSEPGSSPKRRVNQFLAEFTSSTTPTPIARPARAVQRKETAARVGEKAPVRAAATAKRKATRPLTSLKRDSPSRIEAIRRGKGL